MEEKLYTELYNLLNNNLEEKRKEIRMDKYNEAERIISERSIYEYNFMLQEFSHFIKSVVIDYSNPNEMLTNRCISEKEIVYSDYYTKDAISYLKDFLEREKLGTLKYNKVIIWNDNTSVHDLIESFFEALNSLKDKMVTMQELKEEYYQMVADDKEVYGPLISDEFRKKLVCNENIPYRFYYDLQLELETYHNENIIKEIHENEIAELFNINARSKKELIELLNFLMRIKDHLNDYLEIKKDDSINRKRG